MTKEVPDTRARHAVLALLDDTTQEALATSCGLTRQSDISLLVTRNRLAGRRTAAKLQARGVLVSWWDEPPTPEQLVADERRTKGAA